MALLFFTFPTHLFSVDEIIIEPTKRNQCTCVRAYIGAGNKILDRLYHKAARIDFLSIITAYCASVKRERVNGEKWQMRKRLAAAVS